MRPLEILVAILALLSAVGALLANRKGWLAFLLLIATVGALAVQAMWEGTRWQMAPFYFSAVILGTFLLSERSGNGRMRTVAVLAAIALGFGGILLCEVLPVFSFPRPTGPYGVGTQVRYLVDKDRPEQHIDGAKGSRELMIQLWYPTEPGVSGVRSAYRDRRTTSSWTSQLSLVKTNAIVDAPIAPVPKGSGGYPILLFSPSWSGQRVQNTFQVEELASHGYVVVAMDHPYGTGTTVFPDGRIVRSTIGGGEDYSSQPAFEEFIRKATDETKIRARDAQFVLDVLEKWNTADPQGLLAGKIRMTSVGIFGHSLGGTVAVQACWLDPRFKAALDMDGMLAAESATDGAEKPVLFMMEAPGIAPDASLDAMSEQKRRTVEFDRSQENLMKASLKRYGGYWMTVAGTTHKSFSDSPMFSPLKSLSGAGSTDPKHVFEIANAYTLAFFDKYLKREDSALLKAQSGQFQEVELQPWEAERVH